MLEIIYGSEWTRAELARVHHRQYAFCMRPTYWVTKLGFLVKINCTVLTCLVLLVNGHTTYNTILMHAHSGVLKMVIEYQKIIIPSP